LVRVIMIKRIVVLMIFAGLCVSVARGTTTASGDVNPSNTTSWVAWGTVFCGVNGVGDVRVDNGSDAFSRHCRMGYNPGSFGEITVTGAGSTWTNSEDFSVGYEGAGTLNITDGGFVQNDGATFVARYAGSVGEINFNNGVLTTGSFWGAVSDLHGFGTINTKSLISDVDMIFAATADLTQTLTLTSPGQSIFVNLDIDGSTPLGVGYSGEGSMRISDGMDVQSTCGYLGYKSGSTGEVSVSGSGSTWNNTTNLFVGGNGDGVLNITDGGVVNVVTINIINDIYSSVIAYEPGSTGVATVSGPGSSWTNGSFNEYGLSVGNGGSGTLAITNGASVNNSYGAIGKEASATGVVTVSGVGSTWINSKDLYVGDEGDGTLNITDGGSVNSRVGNIARESGSIGSATVSGSGSTWTSSSVYVGDKGDGTLNVIDGGAIITGGVLVGYNGDGTLKITNGATVDADGYCYIGRESRSTGTVTVSGAGSTFTNSKGLYVGFNGKGTLNITGGAMVSSETASLSFGSGSDNTATISGAGSTWWNSSELTVGNSTLDINDSGFVRSGSASIGYGASDTGGMVTVSGTGSTWTNRFDLRIGLSSNSNGTLSITDGGAVSSGYAYLGYRSGSSGTVTVSGAGSNWISSGWFYVGEDGNGVLNVTSGGAVNFGIGYIGHESGSTGSVTVSGAGSTWAIRRNLTIGEGGAGSLDITDGGLVSVAEVLTIDKYGDADSFINMSSGGMLALAGAGANSIEAFLGLVQGSDAIRYWDESASDWADITAAIEGVDYVLDRLVAGDLTGYTVLTVRLVPMPGDTNYDNVVDDLDYGNLLAQFGGSPGDESADFNGDGRVDLADFAILRGHFGSGVASPGPESRAVTPEPATLTFLALGGLVVLRRRRF
jgi:fibronectin-binding autotransporter adhesin